MVADAGAGVGACRDVEEVVVEEKDSVPLSVSGGLRLSPEIDMKWLEGGRASGHCVVRL